MIPSLKNVRLKEYGYIPVGSKVISGTVSKQADEYYVSVIIDTDIQLNKQNNNEVKQLEKKLKREQRKLSRKYESLKERNPQGTPSGCKNTEKEGGNATRQNIKKQVFQVQRHLSNASINLRDAKVYKIAL